MSNLKTKRVQIGDHSTATNNFVMHQSDTPDGKVHISNGTLDDHTSKMTLAHDGKLGIGTTSPEADFHAQNSAGGGAIQIGRDTGPNEYQYLNFGGNATSDDAWQIGKKNNSADDVGPAKGFYVYDMANSASRLVIDTSGSVGVGTTSPSDKLHVGGANAYIRVDRSNGEAGISLLYNSDNTKRADIATQTNGDLKINVNSAERMRINTAGQVTMDYQPSANVTVGSTSPGSYAVASTNSVIVGSTSRHNIGGHYNTSNGRFTCPTSGRYFVSFSSNFYNNNAGGWIMPRFQKNGSTVVQNYQNTGSNPTWIHISASIIIDCSQGDYLEIYNATASGAGGGMDVGLYSGMTFHKIA